MTVDASTAANQMISRIEEVLQDKVPAYCSKRSTSDYPLPAPDPEHLVVSQGNATFDFEMLAGPNVWMTIRYGQTEYDARQTGSGTHEAYQATTEVGVSIMSRVHAGLDLPSRNGRQLTPAEWERTRAEKYRGVLMDVATEHIADGSIIYLCLLDSGVTFPPFEVDEEQTVIMGQVGLQILQNVRVPVPN
jgi:hypothetical protein